MSSETITQINAPPEFIEAEAKLYLNELQKGIAGIKGADLSKGDTVNVKIGSVNVSDRKITMNIA